MKKNKIPIKYRVRKLLFIAEVKARNEVIARKKAREYLFEKDMNLISSSFYIEVNNIETDKDLFVCNVFNLYFPEHLSFFDRIRHLLSMVNATTFNIGITPNIIVIE